MFTLIQFGICCFPFKTILYSFFSNLKHRKNVSWSNLLATSSSCPAHVFSTHLIIVLLLFCFVVLCYPLNPVSAILMTMATPLKINETPPLVAISVFYFIIFSFIFDLTFFYSTRYENVFFIYFFEN